MHCLALPFLLFSTALLSLPSNGSTALVTSFTALVIAYSLLVIPTLVIALAHSLASSI